MCCSLPRFRFAASLVARAFDGSFSAVVAPTLGLEHSRRLLDVPLAHGVTGEVPLGGSAGRRGLKGFF
jgi:hypothetical protein